MMTQFSIRRRRSAAPLLACLALTCFALRALALPFPSLHHGRRPLVVGYLSNSSFHLRTPFLLKTLVTSGSAGRLDQINYASASVRGGRCSLSDPEADLQTVYTANDSVDGTADKPSFPVHGYFHQLAELKRRYPRLKVFISLEGRASDFAEDAQPENRAAFVSSCVNLYLRGQFAGAAAQPGLFDGVDIDWESPHQQDAANFQALIEEFRRQMNAVRPGLRLSVALGQSPHMLPGTDFRALAPLVDEFGVMNYDYTGPWDHTTGFLAPLFSTQRGYGHSGSVQSTIDQYLAAGIPAGKMLMGLPFYGYGWRDVDDRDNGLYQPGHGVRGDRPYRFIRAQGQPKERFREPSSRAPWIFDGQTFWTYDDPVSIRYKTSYAARRHLAGVMIWELSGDTDDGVLLDSAWRALHHPLPARVFARPPATPPRHSEAVAQR